MRNATIALCLAGALALAACTPSEPSSAPAPDASAPAATPAATPATAATVAPTPTTGVWFEPASVSACAPANQIVNIHWNFSADPSLEQVKIIVPSKDAQGVETEGLFALTLPEGNKESGPWMGAGSTVIVRSAADDRELGRASVGSIPCQ